MKKSKQIKFLTKELAKADKRALAWEGKAHQANRRADECERQLHASQNNHTMTRAALDKLRSRIKEIASEFDSSFTDVASNGTTDIDVGLRLFYDKDWMYGVRPS